MHNTVSVPYSLNADAATVLNVARTNRRDYLYHCFLYHNRNNFESVSSYCEKSGWTLMVRQIDARDASDEDGHTVI